MSTTICGLNLSTGTARRRRWTAGGPWTSPAAPAPRSPLSGIDRISGMCGIVDLDAIFLVPDLLIEIGGEVIAVGDHGFSTGMRLFRSATRRTDCIPTNRRQG